METHRILVVGRTRAGSMYCVGALTNRGVALRLKRNHQVPFWPEPCPFHVGTIHEIEAEPAVDTVENPHHREDVRVFRHGYRDKWDTQSLVSFLIHQKLVRLGRFPNDVFDYRGSENPMRRDIRGVYSVPKARLPDLLHSTAFWRTSNELRLNDSGDRYIGSAYRVRFNIKYVGVADPLPLIPAGAIVRLSTSAYWEEGGGSFLQISGWFL